MAEAILKNKSAFTLTEMMVTVVIIAILAAISVPMYSGMVAKSRAKEGPNALAMVRIGMEQFRATRFTYPTNFTQLNLAGFTYTPNATSATYGSGRSQYTVILETAPDGQSYLVTASGHPLNDGLTDVWTLTNAMSEAEHTNPGY